jgi:fibronectin-binding autotransporter adhesin
VVIKGGRITTSGAQSYGENAFLDNLSRTTVLNTTNSDVSFAGTLKNNTAAAEALTINAGSGAVTFTGAVGATGANNAIGALEVNSTGDTTFTSTVDAASVTTNTGGRVFIQSGRISTTGAQSYGENVFLDNASRTTVLNTTDSAVTFAGTLKNNTSNAEALTITAGSGDVMFTGAVGTSAANGAIGALGITNTGNVTFTNTVDASSVSTATGSTLRIKGGRVTTTWAQWYGGDVLLDNALQSTTLTTTNSDVDFRGFVKNYAATPQSLTVNAGSGDVTFVGVAGVTGNALGDVVINSEGVTTLQSTVDAASLKTDVNGVNPVTLGGRVVIQGGRISTSGEQHYAELVKLDKTDVSVNATTVLNTNGSAVTFDAAIKNTTAQAQNLTINVGAGDVTFTGAVGATGASGPLGDVVVNSEGLTTFVRTVDAASLKTDVDTAHINVNAATNKVTIQGGRITTTGEQDFAELVVLGNGSHATVLNTTNSPVTFDKAIVNANITARDLTINAGTGSVTFTGAVGEDSSGANGALGHLVINSAGETLSLIHI